SEIVFGSGIAADQLAHFPPAPGGWASIGKFVRGIALMRNARVMMKMMATQRGRARTVRRRHLKARGKQKDKPEFHYALQRVETAGRPSWLDVSCGEAGRLIDQCGDKRASTLTNLETRKSSCKEQTVTICAADDRSIRFLVGRRIRAVKSSLSPNGPSPTPTHSRHAVLRTWPRIDRFAG